MFNKAKIELKERLKDTLPIKLLLKCRDVARAGKYRLQYRKLCSELSTVSDIEVISIEFSSVCNLKCRYCYLKKNERPIFLDFGLYVKLLRELCDNNKYRIKIMECPISGCFFLHPSYKDIIRITKEYKDRYENFSPWIILNDNMMLFDEDKADFIFKQGIINQIICSIDGVDKETFEHMRPNADFEIVLKNTLCLLNKNRNSENRIVIQINNGCDDICDSKKIDFRLQEIFNQVDHVTRWRPLDWNESFHTDNPIYKPRKHFCSFVFESVTLSSSGAITKCCMDLQETTRYGDFTKDSLESIWLSDARKEFLQLMHQGKRDLIPGCSKCSIGYVGQNKFPA